jgi:hypothetical protein
MTKMAQGDRRILKLGKGGMRNIFDTEHGTEWLLLLLDRLFQFRYVN